MAKKKNKNKQIPKKRVVTEAPVVTRTLPWQYLTYAGLLATLLLVTWSRIQLLDIPIERDEGGFAYIAHAAMNGQQLYTELHDIKLPGLYYTYGLFIKLFGYTPTGIHLGLLIFNLATILLLFFFVREVFNNLVAVVTASIYGIMSLSPNVFGFATHATQLLVLPGFGGMWLLIRALQSRSTKGFNWKMLVAGLLFGYAFTIKQQAVYFMLLGGFYLLYDHYQQKPVSWVAAIPKMSWLVLGSVLPYLLIVGWFSLQGRFSDLWFWTFEYPRAEGLGKTLDQSWFLLKLMGGMVTRNQWALWLLAGIGWVSSFFIKMPPTQKFLVVAVPLLMFGGVATGFHFYPHYFVMMIPAIALSVGVLLNHIYGFLIKRNLSLAMILPVGIFLLALFQIVAARPAYFFNPDTEAIIKTTYGSNPFVEAHRVGEYIRSISQPGDQIVVFGSEPELMMYTGLESVSGHLFIYPLTDGRYYSEKLQEEMIRAVQEKKPRFAVFASFGPSWLQKDTEGKFYKKMMDELRKNYNPVPVALADSSEPETVYRFGEEVKNFQPGNERILWVYERNR